MSTEYNVVQDKLVALQKTKLKPMLVYHSENTSFAEKIKRMFPVIWKANFKCLDYWKKFFELV